MYPLARSATPRGVDFPILSTWGNYGKESSGARAPDRSLQEVLVCRRRHIVHDNDQTYRAECSRPECVVRLCDLFWRPDVLPCRNKSSIPDTDIG